MGSTAAAAGVTTRLLLDEHYAAAIAVALRERGHDVEAAVANPDLRGTADDGVFQWSAQAGRRIVTENIKDFRPLLLQAVAAGAVTAPLLLVSPRRFPRGGGARTAVFTAALHGWLTRPDAHQRPLEDWLESTT